LFPLVFSLLNGYFAAAAFFFGAPFGAPVSVLTDLLLEPVFSSTNFVPAAAAPATAPPTIVETASTTTLFAFATMPFDAFFTLRRGEADFPVVVADFFVFAVDDFSG